MDDLELVAVSTDAHAVVEESRELESRETIFSQKCLRSSTQVVALRRETKTIAQAIQTMHNDMARLDELIAAQSTLQSSLSAANYTLEGDFMLKLKGMEQHSVEMDVSLPSVTDAETARELVAYSHKVCPYSNATRGNIDVTITANGEAIG